MWNWENKRDKMKPKKKRRKRVKKKDLLQRGGMLFFFFVKLWNCEKKKIKMK
jgi:hypothetical protein